jgi:hypothetical protein
LAITPMEQALKSHKYRAQDPGLVWLRRSFRRAVMRMDGTDASQAADSRDAAKGRRKFEEPKR